MFPLISKDENDESKSRYQSLTRTVVEQELSGTRVICEKNHEDS